MNPSLEIVREVAKEKGWVWEKKGDRLTVTMEGSLTPYELLCAVLPEWSLCTFVCGFSYRISKSDEPKARELVRIVNEHMAVGNFNFWPESEMVSMHYALPLPDQKLQKAQGEAVFDIIFRTCERYAPAFAYIASSSMSAQDAFAAVSMISEGSA